ncbi:MAG: hypothetical protein GY721_10695 [Deltaproteobacteria bacterium]|nr:hypothetical protein [Deltaproteobacteria bacterium]
MRDETATATVRSLKATATIRVEQPGHRAIRGRAHIIVERPGLFRIEVLGPFNQTAIILASNEQELSLLNIKEGVLYRWSDRKGPYPFNGNEIVDLLLGALPGTAEEWELDKEGGLVKEERSFVRDDPAGGAVRINMADFNTLSGARIPYFISMQSPLGRLSVQYRKVTLNIDTDGVTFTLPASARVGIKEIINR